MSVSVLGLDTTSKFASIAYLQDGEVVSEVDFSSEENTSVSLLPKFDLLFKRLQMTVDDIDVFGITIGPGLFTGIRVGLATLKGILFKRQKPVVPINTLEAIAYKVRHQKDMLVPLIDARRDDVYLACYQSHGGELVEKVSPVLVGIDRLNKKLLPYEPICFIGSGAHQYRDLLQKRFNGSNIIYPSHFLAAEVGRIAFQRFIKKKFILDLQDLVPLYIRKSDAEVHVIRKGRNKVGKEGKPTL